MTEEKRALLREMARHYGTDAVLVYNPQWHKENYRYLTGLNFIGPMVVTMYLAGTDKFCVLYSSPWDKNENQPHLEGVDHVALVGPEMEEPGALLKEAKAASVAVSGTKYLPFLIDAALRKAGVTQVAAEGPLENARLRKTPQEIAYLEQAVHLSESAWQVFMQGVADGLNEYQIAANVEYHLKKNGAEDNFLLLATGGKEIRGMTPPMNRTAKPGDMVSFIKDKKQDVRMIKQITRYRIETAEFTFIMRYVFGENMTISKLLPDWQAWSIVEGYGKKGFNRDQCLVLEIC